MSIVINNLNYTYSPRTNFSKVALKDITFEIKEGEFFGIIGHTGSGKSTLIQHFNALTPVQSGELIVAGIDLSRPKTSKIDFKKLRATVGMVFQYPEYQLFDATVLGDVSFGPKNLGLEKDEILERAKQAIGLVGLDYESVKDKSPFELSGGQKRRVAIAGVIAMKPQILVLDEPTAGLDPHGKREILDLILTLKESVSKTVIMISHDMDEIARLSDRVAVLADGQLQYLLPPSQLFEKSDSLEKMGLDIPTIARVVKHLNEMGKNVPHDIFTVEHAVEYFSKTIKNKNQ
ncbi:MAG: energy-coupling factor transporter ATPase [Firmicutes bacterium]|nr:energy-coupling factor transporter ATPase [Bacillota bacterium]